MILKFMSCALGEILHMKYSSIIFIEFVIEFVKPNKVLR